MGVEVGVGAKFSGQKMTHFGAIFINFCYLVIQYLVAYWKSERHFYSSLLSEGRLLNVIAGASSFFPIIRGALAKCHWRSVFILFFLNIRGALAKCHWGGITSFILH
jgi:hypothetical protein